MGAEFVTRALGGKWYGQRGMAMCPVHDNRHTPALSLADGSDGKLLVHCFAGCDGTDILRELSRRNIEHSPSDSGPSTNTQTKSSDRTAYALSLWDCDVPIGGTIAEQYLSRRGIVPPYPRSLRFCRSMLHKPTQTRHPAMIALVTTGADNQPVGLHRTYLTKAATKADVHPAKMMLGSCGGGAVRLADDGHGAIIICEGIETGLSLRDALALEVPKPRIWAALSTSGVAGVLLPKTVSEIVIAPDGDAPGRNAAEKLARRAVGEGHHVRIMTAPIGKDWNDVVQNVGNGSAT